MVVDPIHDELVLEWAPGATPNTYPRTWTALTDRLGGRRWTLSTTRGRSSVLSPPQAGKLTVVLDNHDGALTPENPNSPWYPNVITDVPIRTHTNRSLGTDTFNRADTPGTGSGFQLGTSSGGQAWSGSTGNSPTIAPQWHISSNQARLSSYTGVFHEDAWATIDAGAADCDVQVTFVTCVAQQALVFRRASATNSLRLMVDDGLGSYSVYNNTGSNARTLLYTVPTVVPAAGDVVKVRLRGSSILIFVNGIEVGSLASTINQTSTNHGLGGLDNFTHTAALLFDDFSITNFGPMFEGYVQSYDPDWPNDDPEGYVEITAVDGLAPLAGDSILNSPGLIDTFTRADSADGSIGSLETGGQAWLIENKDASFPSHWRIKTNRLQVQAEVGDPPIAVTNQTRWTAATVDAGSSSYNVRVSWINSLVYAGFSAQGDGPYFFVRYQDLNNWIAWNYSTAYGYTGDGFHIIKCVAGTRSYLKSVAIGRSAGPFVVTARVLGSRITITVQNVNTDPLEPYPGTPSTITMEVIDTSFTSSTRVGVGMHALYNGFLGPYASDHLLGGMNDWDDFQVALNLPEELTGARVNRLLDFVGWPADLRQIADGTFTIAAKDLNSLDPDFELTILDEITQVANSELGLFYIRGDGTAVFEDRTTRVSPGHVESRGTVGNQGGGDVPFVGWRPHMDNYTIANIVSVRRAAVDRNEVQTVEVVGATGGQFYLNKSGDLGSYTGPIDWDATLAEFQTSMDVLWGEGVTEVTGPDGGPWAVEFIGAMGAQDVPIMEYYVGASTLTGTDPTVTIAETVPGESSSDTPDSVTVQDSASIALHWRRKFPEQQTQLINDDDVVTLAGLLLNRWRREHFAPEQIVLDWDDPDQYELARQLDISDRVNFDFVPFSSVAQGLAGGVYIEGVAHSVNQEKGQTTWRVSPAGLSSSYWILEDPAFGILEQTTVAG